MKAFIEPLQELSGYEDMTKAAMQPGLVTISGCIDAQKPHMIYTLGRTRSRRLIVTFHEQKAKELYDDYRFFDPSVVYYPAKDVLFYQSDIRGNLLTAERISALRAIHENEQVTVITTFDEYDAKGCTGVGQCAAYCTGRYPGSGCTCGTAGADGI